MIRHIIFDMGGVLVTIDHREGIRRFTDLGIREAERLLDPYRQSGPFGALEQGDIGTEEFRAAMSRLAARPLSREDCAWAWLGYIREAPARNLDALARLRRQGYHLLLLSNMNPFINEYLERELHLSTYFDACYRSFEIHRMKPDPGVFELILEREGILPQETLLVDDGEQNCATARTLGLHTFRPRNGEDWTHALFGEISARDKQG